MVSLRLNTGSLMAEPSDMLFMVDHMLIKLGKYLRVLGYDADWDTSVRTHELIRRANAETRIFLTRNRHLADRYPAPDRSITISSVKPTEQLAQVVGETGLDQFSRLFSRCIRCNLPLDTIEDKSEIGGMVHPNVYACYQQFYRCPGCGTVFWKGSHVRNTCRKLWGRPAEPTGRDFILAHAGAPLPASGARGAGRPSAVLIDNRRFRNSATSFWTGLIDEVLLVFPAGSAIELSAPAGDTLLRKELFPEKSLSDYIENQLAGRARERLEDIIAELALLGPPGPVAIRVLSCSGILLDGELPIDVVDSSVLTYLLAWLLEWAGIPESAWNDDMVAGRIVARDPVRERSYEIEYELSRRHLSEGLYRRTVVVKPVVLER